MALTTVTGEGKELLAGAHIISKQAVYGRGESPDPTATHPPQRHARVIGFDDHARTLGTKVLVDPIGDLHREAFLGLEVTSKASHDSGEFG